MNRFARNAHARALLRLPTIKRVARVLGGQHQSVYQGHSLDFDDLTEYHPGDDLNHLDWKASARSGKLIIRRFEREVNLAVVLVVDTGRHMGALAPSGEVKAEIALIAAEICSYVADKRGDLLGLLSGDSAATRTIPASGGRAHHGELLTRLEGDFAAGGLGALTHLLGIAARTLGRRSLVIVITDGSRPAAQAESDLIRLKVRHEVVVLRIADMRPGALPQTGYIRDVDLGALPDFVRADPVLLAEAEAAASRIEDGVTAMLRRCGIPSTVIGSSTQIVPAIIELLGRHHRAGR